MIMFIELEVVDIEVVGVVDAAEASGIGLAGATWAYAGLASA